MHLPYANPVISAVTVSNDILVENFKECRRIHKHIQAGEADDVEAEWDKNLIYLMMMGDCFAREIERRGLEIETNLILQHPLEPFPDYWKNIIVPEFLEKWKPTMKGTEWGPDIYPEEKENVGAGESTEVSAELQDETNE